jgi:hypothetical protein|tara:strand:- start:270 stop:554 length:285 start_codon:yes stop_codon:yes gene_type:complete
MNFYKKAIFVFILFVFFIVVFVKVIDPVIEKQISNIFADRKLSTKLKKELINSTEEFTPEKREFYKNIVKKIYIKWKPLITESIEEADKEIGNN